MEVRIDDYPYGGGAGMVMQAEPVYNAYQYLCEKTGKISKNGETIVCLPHRVVVEIQGGEGNVDSLVR